MKEFRFAICPFGNTGTNDFVEWRRNFLLFKTKWKVMDKHIYSNHPKHTYKDRVKKADHQGEIVWTWDKNK